MTAPESREPGKVMVYQCAGCGANAMARISEVPEGWRVTDAAWCPECRWLA